MSPCPAASKPHSWPMRRSGQPPIIGFSQEIDMTQHWIDAGNALQDEMVALRRAIHAEPELGLHNPKTTAKAKGALAGLPLEIFDSKSTSGFMAVLRGPANGRTVLLRGDMDALPLVEETGLPFTSQVSGAMHACGHD